MSAGAQAAVLTPPGLTRGAPRPGLRAAERPLVRLAAFAALGLYGILRWGTLLSPAPVWRLFGLLALAVLVAGSVPLLLIRSRALAIAGTVLAALAMLAVAGVPLAWIVHVRIAVTANGIGQGLSALPRMLVPYDGINQWVRIVTVLGAAVLLFDAALMLGYAPRPLGDLRRASAALPLVVLAVVPSTLARPSLAYLHGLILFALIAALLWGERVRRHDAAVVTALAAIAGAGAMAGAPALDQHHPWLNYQSLAGTLAPGHLEAFDWTQRYGPLNWPRTGREVLDVQAAHGYYWKAENLDVFDGRGWVAGAVQVADPLAGVDPGALARWTETLQVTIRAMRTTDVIAGGTAAMPAHIAGVLLPGASAGTWATTSELGPGDSYLVRAYVPQPTAAQLSAAGASQRDAPPLGYRSLTLPTVSIPLPKGPATLPALPVLFGPFGSRSATESIPNLTAAQSVAAIEASPYARAFALARRLELSAASPYAFVAAVQRYLLRGYSYNEYPPASSYPLESFLFRDRIGYCQQFSGAMALLLRMGGVPARVAAGFTNGTYDNAGHRWVVSDLDAHAWVEAWFPHYGWVRFDPTPTAAPARGGFVALPALRGSARHVPAAHHAVRRPEPARSVGIARRAPRSSGRPTALILAGVLALLALVAFALRYLRPAPQPSADQLVAELQRALARSGRPVGAEVTLSSLERRFSASPEAEGYVRAVRLARFARSAVAPTQAQRRAFRAQLRIGLGPLGRVRAWWALPPGPAPRSKPSSSRRSRVLHFR